MINMGLFKDNNIDFEDIDIVAFDIYDTLLYRKVSPDHVHRIWANMLIDQFSLKKTAEQIVKLKFDCGRIAKLENIHKGKDREYEYKQMTELLRKKLGIELGSAEFFSMCVDFELQVEKSVCYVPEEIKSLVSRIQQKKQVVCISDFYLPANVLMEILNSKGVQINRIYVSSEYLLQKKTGRLYSAVLEELKIPASRIVMLGDNKVSDVDNAIKVGLRAIYLENSAQHEYYAQFESNIRKSRKDFQRFLDSTEVNKRTIPFSHVSFLMYIFINRLYKQLKKDKCKHVLFMSREGELFKKLFDSYQKQVVEESERIETHYFYVSRRATIVPSIHKAEKCEFREIYKNYPEMSVRTFLKNLGLNDNERVLNALGSIDLDREIHDFSESVEYNTLLNSRVFRMECLSIAEKQRALFTKYLNDMDIDYRKKGLFLVDVGYSGTSQNNIFNIFKGDVDIHGYYLISYANKKSISEHNTKKGMVYDIASNHRKNVFTYNSAVIEMLSMASHCGVESYAMRDNKVVPVFHDNEHEIICYKEVISHLQKNIIEEFNKIAVLVDAAYLDENTYLHAFEKQYKRFIYNPTVKEMEEYLKIPFVDDFAIYREYTPEKESEKHKYISFNGIKEIVCSRGSCLKNQNTHWIAAALYKLDMRCLNPVLYVFSGFTMKMFDVMAAAIRKKKGVKE